MFDRALTLVCIIALACCPDVRRTFPTNMIFLGIFVRDYFYYIYIIYIYNFYISKIIYIYKEDCLSVCLSLSVSVSMHSHSFQDTELKICR